MLGEIRKFIDGLLPATVAPAGEENPDGTVSTLVRNGYSVHTFPRGLRAQRVHEFFDVASFAEFLNRHAGDRVRVEILMDGSRIVAGLEPSEIHSDVLVCVLQNHPWFVPWEKAFQQEDPLTQRELYSIVRAADAALGDQADALASSIRQIRLIGGSDVQADVDERGMHVLSGTTAKQELTTKLPPEFEISVPIYQGIERDGKEPVYKLRVLLSVEAMGPKLGFSLSAPDLELRIADAQEDALLMLSGLLDEGFLVGRGRFYVKEVTVVP